MGRLFGTDGVRGVANSELTPELAFKLGKAAAKVLAEGGDAPLFLIGKDTRISGDMLEDAMSAGILSMGGSVIKAGVLPTPAIAYLVKYYNAAAGVVISASHNPFEYNGIKFFNGQGFKLDDAIEDRIEELILRGRVQGAEEITGAGLGSVVSAEENALKLYGDFLASTVDMDLSGIKVVLDCANGASYQVAPRVFESLGMKVTVIHNTPNGININDACGSTHPESLCEKVRETGANLGLAFDGDADRLIAVDENGNVVDGDRVIFMCARMLKEKGQLPHNSVTVTIMSNLGFHKKVESMGCKVEVTKVGDRYVLENMLKTGCVIGGEQSGHIIFLNHSTTGDGMLSALQLLCAYKRDGRKLSEMAYEMPLYPQVLINAKVKNENKEKYVEDEVIQAMIRSMEEEMEGDGRVVIRPSGTEPLVRVMLEGSDIEKIRSLAEELAQLISAKLG